MDLDSDSQSLEAGELPHIEGVSLINSGSLYCVTTNQN